MEQTGPYGQFQQFYFDGFEYRFDAETSRLLVYLRYSLRGGRYGAGADEHDSMSDDVATGSNSERFTEIITFPLEEGRWAEVDRAALERALAALHVMAGISYYKTFLPAKMAGVELDATEVAFWTKVYQRGLGEFFFRNQIDFRGLINFPQSKTVNADTQIDKHADGFSSEQINGRNTWQITPLPERSLVPIGGGKDSLVTIELLKEAGMDFTLFSLRDAAPIAATATLAGKPRIVVERQLDPRLFELNGSGALNGHVPITALVAFVSAVCGLLYGYRYLVFSLEQSANYGQLSYHGMDINHQYSKSAEFEADVRNYLAKYVHPGLEFFSMLRPLSELSIARIFASLPAFESYAPHFTSCNANFTILREKSPVPWCGQCPKCAFVFLILAPYLPRQRLTAIFGENLADREDLLPLYEELLGLKNFKPFECVGTPEESRAALELVSRNPDYANDLLIRTWLDKWRGKWPAEEIEGSLKQTLSRGEQGFLPEQFWQIIKNHA